MMLLLDSLECIPRNLMLSFLRDNDGLAVRFLPFTCEARIQVRGSTLDHKAELLFQDWPEPLSLTSGS